MFGIEPRQVFIGMEGGRPLKGTVGLELHAEEWIRQAREVVVVDTGVDKCSRETNLLPVSVPLAEPSESMGVPEILKAPTCRI